MRITLQLWRRVKFPQAHLRADAATPAPKGHVPPWPKQTREGSRRTGTSGSGGWGRGKGCGRTPTQTRGSKPVKRFGKWKSCPLLPSSWGHEWHAIRRGYARSETARSEGLLLMCLEPRAPHCATPTASLIKQEFMRGNALAAVFTQNT